MKQVIILVIICIFYFSFSQVSAQTPTGVIRGQIVDDITREPLTGVTVTLVNQSQTTLTGADGSFRFEHLEPGIYQISASHMGYQVLSLDLVRLVSGKETVLLMPMTTDILVEKEVRVRANSRRNRPINEMSLVSARAFTVEETQKYAAAVNDPLRMATAFPGVMSADDGGNQIIIRGNSPAGLLWRMEGMDIPNPNHFSAAGSSGGGISILSAQLLANSDFLTGAFAAEYGNALSGVFDLHLRKGNDEKREFTLQAGVLGLNLAAEGPLARNYKGSYLVNYRYSTLGILDKLGVLSDESSTNFQDLSYHIQLPTSNAGTFTIFGFGGLSKSKYQVVADSNKWEGRADRSQTSFIANTGYSAITHQIALGGRARLQTGVGYAITKNGFDEDLMDFDYQLQNNYQDRYLTRKLNFRTTLHYRLGRAGLLQTGVQASRISIDYYQLKAENEGEPLEERINQTEATYTQQAFAQLKWRIAERLSVTGGLSYLRLALNRTSAIDPRLAASWQTGRRSNFSIAYGLHSQMQALGVYFAQAFDQQGQPQQVNRDLKFTRAHHLVGSFQYKLNQRWLLKAEAYYQHLFQVPVGIKPESRFSTLNIIEDFVSDPLANRGKGRNYGLELSAERFLHNQFYMLFSQALYQSKYTAQDGIERNTRFNGNYISTLVVGRDFNTRQAYRKWSVNLKTVLAGGQRTTPIDLEASRQAGYTVFDEERSFSQQNPMYFRTDLRISIQWNRRKHSSTLSLDIQNVTNRLNQFAQWYDVDQEKIIVLHQTGLIPILNWRIDL